MSLRFFANHPQLTKCAICGATACALHGPFAHIGHMKLECPIVSEQVCASVRLYGVQPDLEGRGLLRVVALSTSSSTMSSAGFQTTTTPSS